MNESKSSRLRWRLRLFRRIAIAVLVALGGLGLSLTTASTPLRLLIAALSLGAGALVFLAGRKKLDDKSPAERCTRCGYSLTELNLPRCPECGALVGFEKSAEEMGIAKELRWEKRR